MKRVVFVLAMITFYVGIGWLAHLAKAHGGTGGSIAMPGPCDYPFIGHQGYAAGAGVWYCDGPPEENGSRWHGEGMVFNAGGPTGSGDYGFSFAGFGVNIPGGIIGGGDGWQGYLWPDNTAAPWPNPPGLWKNHLIPKLPPPEHRGPPAPPVDLAGPRGPPADTPLVPDDVNPVPPNTDSLKPDGGS